MNIQAWSDMGSSNAVQIKLHPKIDLMLVIKEEQGSFIFDCFWNNALSVVHQPPNDSVYHKTTTINTQR
jgi:hypothetical protein